MTPPASRKSVAAATIGVALLMMSVLTKQKLSTNVLAFAPVVGFRNAFNPYRHERRTLLYSTATASTSTSVGPRLAINDDFPGLQKIYSNPDIFIIHDFLQDNHCQDLIERALEKKLERSPVAYAGWTEDFKDLVELAARGPVAWIALIGAWFQVKDSTSANQLDLVLHALQNFAVVLVLAIALIAAFTYSRAEGLKSMRTSTSITLDDLSDPTGGPLHFVRQAANLFRNVDDDIGYGNGSDSLSQEAAHFEAPTVIRYEADQVLAPHYDANRSADTEDANRGGQTLATLLVYLNDVERGGLTRFGKLYAANSLTEYKESQRSDSDGKLVIQPKQGDALLFFPADRFGTFDPRTEHEGMPAIEEKWIARIWRHKSHVPPPFGLSESALKNV